MKTATRPEPSGWSGSASTARWAGAASPHLGRDPHPPLRLGAALRNGCRPRGCRAPARRVLGRRVRYVIGCEPGQVQGRRWRVTHG
ncbi:tryptophan synthase subunit(beta) [Streptomyces kaniharaensis]|uniref:Tryptophan synthase subunit(Beta) n=1 Tax=Streptomyces kaniharaensis TaxID=212423 RepID=A0A6N7KK88_9ACTN|nr:tryptophan synthase subunit(beta) [Streptomyces kaniharaensis]MQS11791.1 tryptophan synthase subunit(beta) [Streptomyces kaniharaensis]